MIGENVLCQYLVLHNVAVVFLPVLVVDSIFTKEDSESLTRYHSQRCSTFAKTDIVKPTLERMMDIIFRLKTASHFFDSSPHLDDDT